MPQGRAAAWMRRQQARWIAPFAARWLRPDAERRIRPDAERWRRPQHPDELKYSPNQPRVPKGNPDGGQWTSDGAGIWRPYDDAARRDRIADAGPRRGLNDSRVLSDADPEWIIPGADYAQVRRSRGGIGPYVASGGQPLNLTRRQQATLDGLVFRADALLAQVRELVPRWRPTPSIYETFSGLRATLESEISQSQNALTMFPRIGLAPGPYAVESIPARSQSRNFTAAERRMITELGRRYGCHTCGTRDSGFASGSFVSDHQPPNRLSFRYTIQRLFPQCRRCSGGQGGYVCSYVRDW